MEWVDNKIQIVPPKRPNIPEEASVEIVMCANDNPLSDGCRVNSVCYFEWLQKDGGKTVVLFPE